MCQLNLSKSKFFFLNSWTKMYKETLLPGVCFIISVVFICDNVGAGCRWRLLKLSCDFDNVCGFTFAARFDRVIDRWKTDCDIILRKMICVWQWHTHYSHTYYYYYTHAHHTHIEERKQEGNYSFIQYHSILLKQKRMK